MVDNPIKSYNGKGCASVLDGAGDLISRAAKLYREIENTQTPPIVGKAMRKEAELCIEEAIDLLTKVREVRP